MFPASINSRLSLAAEILLDWFWEGQEVKRGEDRLYLSHEASRAVSYCFEVLTEKKVFPRNFKVKSESTAKYRIY
jgi:hypothetical protein